ncbi:chromosome segregation protein SMC [Brevifollis gellanilyticus]|uniref:Chromosome partition protein Smc n=1 Tax=Brevifollis gellanilyticus TaxID=748831 RepID=A0A512M6W7_9BACT|nr:chromosome segregation protein SMC [Brevifollis gellanilyticus]GEP42464.1 chromosome partition protein Smc [Brevifollis gellanilyticus]
MYLKTLSIHGFKSFADKTNFEFHKGVTGIVGPNGCGKSNVVDAIRWVLGETSAKALRGVEMADVIFNGTDKRKPVGMAEVILTMADCEQSLNVDYNEVAICRRVFRDGRSEYRLNNTICRLKDIHDLFAGTGVGRAAYSIMAQGQIDMLLSSKPEDRRTVFEEAAGITKFKGQKREALRKLEYTEANLLRVQDVVAEVKRQMGSLQRQAAKAKRYQLLLDDSRMLDTHLAHKHYSDFSAEKAESDNHVRMMTEQIDQVQARLQTAEMEALETREAYHGIESQINQLRGQMQEFRSQVQSAEGRIGFNNERNEELHMRIRQNDEQIEMGRQTLDQQRRDLLTADEQMDLLRETIENRQAALNEHLTVHNSIVPDRTRLDEDRRAVREMIRQFEGQIAAADSRAQSLNGQISTDRQRHETLSHDLQNAAHAKAASQVEFDHLQQMIAELEQNRNDLDERAKTCARDIIEKRRQRDALMEQLNELQRAVTQRRSRVEIIEQLLQKGEGLAEGTQQVLKGIDNPEVYSVGVRGILASSIEVEPQFITPIEAALRDHLQAVLLTDSELAGQILDRLANQKLGKAALLPADFATMRPQPDRQFVPEGCIAWAIDKVRAKPGVQDITDRLLGNVLIVEDLHTALRMKRTLRDVAIATMKGEFVAADGIIHGGATKEEGSSTLRREAEVRALKAELEGLEYQLLEKEEAAEQMRHQVEDMQREEVTLREQSQRTREEFSQLTGQISVVQRALQQAVTKLESVEWDQNQITTRIQGAEAQIQWQQEEAKVAREQLEGAREHEQQLEVEMESFLRRELESSERLNELRSALALEQNSLHSIERQKAPMASRLHELESTIHRFENEIAAWRGRIEQALSENARFSEQVESQRGAIASIEDHLQGRTEERAAAFERVNALESQLVQLRQQSQGLSESRNRIEVQLTRVDLRLENLINQVQERYNFHISAFEPDYHALMLTIDEQKRNRNRGKKGAAADTEAASAPETSESADEPPAPQPEEAASASNSDEVDIDDITLPGEEGHPDWDFVTAVVGELRQKLEGIGPVNLDAIQEFEELEERHNFLDNQYNDLVRSKEELLEVIAKINDTTKTMFAETFAQVRVNFQNNFRELFGPTAKADLMLIDDEDPLESGIDIIAKPPGKKLQTITLLSGGERSMTAVALLFSIYQVKPSPFCVLDELDAPLDESNISRFLKMLDNFIDNSQFIIVTHNKRTMGRADVIYGVTMQEFGVSKPVGVRMTENNERQKRTPKQEELQITAEVDADEGHHRETTAPPTMIVSEDDVAAAEQAVEEAAADRTEAKAAAATKAAAKKAKRGAKAAAESEEASPDEEAGAMAEGETETNISEQIEADAETEAGNEDEPALAS